MLALRVAAGTVVGRAVGVVPRVGVPVTEVVAEPGALGMTVLGVVRGRELVAPTGSRTALRVPPRVVAGEPVGACVAGMDDGTVGGAATRLRGAAAPGRNGASIVGPPRAALSRSPR